MKTLTLRAFTIADLVVTVALLALLAAMVAPALARTRPRSQISRCLNNTRQLMTAWQMYSTENSGRLVVNCHGGGAQGGAGYGTFGVAWTMGWLDWTISTDNTNTAFLISLRYARLAPYLDASNANLFQCPADNYVSAGQRAAGWARRVRSCSMSINIGAGNAASGPWDSIYQHVLRDSGFIYPGPAETWVLVDEHPDSINDSAFFSPHLTSWIDLPATYHNGAGGFAFADGHSEIHKWTGSLTTVRTVRFSFTTTPAPFPADPDIHWLSYHSARAGTNSY